ncbi:hypothetical protein CCAL6883_08645 [Campylobacter sp. RM6883]|uniref:hypothetical protein n=1 Tax=Campylobacter californiensis TaxID=1032243 RepID=UPI0030152585|nr:hypothetical protein [Campylobacter sp. RM6883]
MKFWLVFVLFLNFADAHVLKVFARQDGNFVEIKSYFNVSSPCKGCEVSIIADGKVIQSTKTDDKGMARLEIKADKFEIFVDGSLAHEKRINFVADMSNVAADEPQESDFILKFISSLAIIFAVFGALYIIKRRR